MNYGVFSLMNSPQKFIWIKKANDMMVFCSHYMKLLSKENKL